MPPYLPPSLPLDTTEVEFAASSYQNGYANIEKDSDTHTLKDDDSTCNCSTTEHTEYDSSSASDRVVRIDESLNQVHWVQSRKDLSPDERHATWYSIPELTDIRQELLTAVCKFSRQRLFADEDENESAVGLEIYATTPCGRIRQQRLRHTTECVLREQAILRQETPSQKLADANSLRHVSHICSRFCVRGAIQRAKQDEEDIQDELWRFRIERASTCQFEDPFLQFFKVLVLDE